MEDEHYTAFMLAELGQEFASYVLRDSIRLTSEIGRCDQV